jgi:hypothetical protein
MTKPISENVCAEITTDERTYTKKFVKRARYIAQQGSAREAVPLQAGSEIERRFVGGEFSQFRVIFDLN